ncbi:DJ-1/PfpI family protein [Thiotrichales bacterium 19S3-7]|nr:DJ-1/PfpI family protein [Thiotrichales bacterium 19S3-7]MCF6802294.1 DJ-1/PfpI family protein [Thiotrichales bacterium 19S3-11]
MTKNLGIVIYDLVQPMDVFGPWEVFSIWKTILNAPINMYLVSEFNTPIHADSQITLTSHCQFDNAPNFDYLIIPGGKGRIEQSNNQNLLNFIKKQAIECDYVLSVCTGMFLLYHAGLLKDKAVTTYWRAAPELKALKDVKFCQDRIVKSGHIWSSGGISSGIDLALALIAEITNPDEAGKVQLLFEYFPEHFTYCNLETKNELPNYQSNISAQLTELPQYIKDYINA